MLHASTQKLIIKLCELTERGDIVWREGTPEHQSLFAADGYTVAIEAEPPSFRILDDKGRVLESAEAADLAVRWPDGEGDFASHVKAMAMRANRVARGAEKAIAALLSSLSAPARDKPKSEPTTPAPPSEAILAQVQPTSAPRPIAPPPRPAVEPVVQATPIPRPPEPPKPQPSFAAAPPPRPITPPITMRPQPPAPPQLQPQAQPSVAPAPPAQPVRAIDPGKPVAPAAEPLRQLFGGISGFAKTEAPPVPPKPPAPQGAQLKSGVAITGISAVSRQTVGQPEPPRPAPANPYKPWS